MIHSFDYPNQAALLSQLLLDVMSMAPLAQAKGVQTNSRGRKQNRVVMLKAWSAFLQDKYEFRVRYWYHHFNLLNVHFNVVFPNSSHVLRSMTRQPLRVSMTQTIWLRTLSPDLPSSLCRQGSWWQERMLVPEQKSRRQSGHDVRPHREVSGFFSFFYMPVSCLRTPWCSTRVN